jgi:hypothetical protein
MAISLSNDLREHVVARVAPGEHGCRGAGATMARCGISSLPSAPTLPAAARNR